MPPAVAQAPIVTRKPDAARTSRMRSASALVVIDPSTSDTSYGPGSTVLDASVNDAMCTDSVIASSSSSQFSSVSWQPSQEANFQTARLGLRLTLDSVSPGVIGHTSRMLSQRATCWWLNTGPSRQTRNGPSWQCTHIATAHCMLRSMDRY